MPKIATSLLLLVARMLHLCFDTAACTIWGCASFPNTSMYYIHVRTSVLLVVPIMQVSWSMLCASPVCEEEVLVEWPRQLKPQTLKHIRLQSHCTQQNTAASPIAELATNCLCALQCL